MRPDPLPASDPRMDAFIETLPEWQQGICSQVRTLVHAAERRRPDRDAPADHCEQRRLAEAQG
jgi:hypothetical protein